MLKKSDFLKIGIGCLAFAGMVNASVVPIAFNSSSVDQGITLWQDIKSVSASFQDANSDGLLETGEKVTFVVDMEKTFTGTHDFDALKIWVDKTPLNIPTSTLYSNTGIWDYNAGVSDYTDAKYTNQLWTGGDKIFSFDYTFSTYGSMEFSASVMCSRDLDLLAAPAYGKDTPDALDWAAWTENTHAAWTNPQLQGETEHYTFNVVPEPSSLSLIVFGITSLAGALYMRRRKSC